MKNTSTLFKSVKNKDDFSQFRIGLASPEMIRSWSHGEVKKSETINYRTLKPERDGLFCSKIFGPIKDWECLCGKYKSYKHKGIVCEKCGVEVTMASSRRERMGHVELVVPVAHIWFLKSLPSRIATLLDRSFSEIESVLYFESYIVIDAGLLMEVEKGQVLSEIEYLDLQSKYAGQFEAKMGAEAIKELIVSMDISAEIKQIQENLLTQKSELKIKKEQKRLKLLKSFENSTNRPEWMILDVLPVLPPDLRPLVALDGGMRFVSSDLNDLYRRVINRNIRLKKLFELKAPDIIMKNEKRMLQEAVDSLLDNGRKARPVVGMNRRPLKSLSDMIKGKQGRFRQNLLGKRVDYSGRSVIVVGPDLKLHQCGLPKMMALELFKPFVYNKLLEQGIASNIRMARSLVEQGYEGVWDILEEITKDHPVLLNRAPTLHRLGVQAFEPILIDGKAIKLHPLVCMAFNADFDGDQMAVHVPISFEAQIEARALMIASNNILSPANGNPIINPSQDIVLGVYYLTRENEYELYEGVFSDINEMLFAYDQGVINIHTKVKVRFSAEELGLEKGAILDTAVGRVLFYVESGKLLPFTYFNKQFDKKSLSKLVSIAYKEIGGKGTVLLSDKMMKVGFKYATKSGISIGIKDFKIPDEKAQILSDTYKIYEEVENDEKLGLITSEEKYNKTIDMWTKANELLAKRVMENLSTDDVEYKGKTVKSKSFNSVYIMADSGARGSATQINQLTGMRGLLAKSSGSIIEVPITSNFREGLTVSEYFISTSGARKGLTDTALKTANSGYLTRRLVDVAQDMVINEEDCGTTEGISMQAVLEGEMELVSLADRALGRLLLEDIKDPEGKVLIAKATYIDEEKADLIKKLGIEELSVRSVLGCKSERGVCGNCYGRDLATGHMVNIGEAVGIIAAQSIGEPGTQLTMRTFHMGGAASRGRVEDHIDTKLGGKVKFNKVKTITNSNGVDLVVSRNGSISILGENGKLRENYKFSYGSTLFVKDGEIIKPNQKLVSWDPHNFVIVSEYEGKVSFEDVVIGLTATEKVDELTGLSSISVLSVRERPTAGKAMRPKILITLSKGINKEIILDDNAVLNISKGQTIKVGDILVKMPKEGIKTKDITGGLPRVAELFEARSPQDSAIFAPMDGVITFGKETKDKRKFTITGLDGSHTENVPKWRQINFQDGDRVEKGEILVEGDMNLNDIVKYRGVNDFSNYLTDEIQTVYRMQGVVINDKHIEVIARQMLKKVLILSSGDSDFVVGEQVDWIKVDLMNKKLSASDKNLVKFEPQVLGITRASLATDSFLSAASFQETTKVLTTAAVQGAVDKLYGLKENVLVGRLIPAGTGFVYHTELRNKEKFGSIVKDEEDFEASLRKEIEQYAKE